MHRLTFSSALARSGKLGMGAITALSRSGLPPTLVITKYSTLRCCTSTERQSHLGVRV